MSGYNKLYFMNIVDLVRYNHTVRCLYFDALSKLSWAQIVELRGLSFDSMRNVFVHLTRVEDRAINYVIPERDNEWGPVNFDSFKGLKSLKSYMQDVQEKTEAYLAKLTSQELSRQIVFPWVDKPNVKVNVETVLSHLVLEDMIHYGELSASFWQMGMEAPYIAFWRYMIRDYQEIDR